jgi:hypothetical protein
MKPLLYTLLVALCASVASAVSIVGTQQPAPLATEVPAAPNQIAGKYTGTWKSDADSGNLTLKLIQDAAIWTAEASFTFQGADIPATVNSVKVDGSTVEVVLGWTIDGTPGVSRLSGKLSDDKLHGSYQSETPDGVTTGTWSVTRTQGA